jgi:hypothetical protein
MGWVFYYLQEIQSLKGSFEIKMLHFSQTSAHDVGVYMSLHIFKDFTPADAYAGPTNLVTLPFHIQYYSRGLTGERLMSLVL